MGKYTINDDPLIDQVIESHMQRIVAEITSHLKPTSIILRGSFGRGEGSVIELDSIFQFLSDYEIDVTAKSPFHRSFFSKLSRKLSDEFGLQAGIRWMRPDCLSRDRIGPFPIGKAVPTISLYEFRYGSQVLWGRDIFSSSPPIYPDQINPLSGLLLLLNRMAESLLFMRLDDDYFDTACFTYYWINKTILACAEALLLICKQYHYTYREREHRFQNLPQTELAFLGEDLSTVKDMIKSATEFKLEPCLMHYPLPVRDTWLQVIPLCKATLRHVMETLSSQNWEGLLLYPEIYLDYAADNYQQEYSKYIWLINLYEIYKVISTQRLPQQLRNHHYSIDLVYAAVPLIFLSYGPNKEEKILFKARNIISKLCDLEPTSHDLDKEWDYLRQKLAALWKAYCY